MDQFKPNIRHEVKIPSGDDFLDGFLFIPETAKNIVLFVHGSGSSRFSSRNQLVAQHLNTARHATLLFDLLTPEEDAVDNITREFRFDIALLANRLLDATQWIRETFKTQLPTIGYFGASTGGAAALVAAGHESNNVQAVVSRGGRPDLAAEYLPLVRAPSLLIVGGDDEIVIYLNNQAFRQMTCTKELKIIPGATHLFEEPGKLEMVARLACRWFDTYL